MCNVEHICMRQLGFNKLLLLPTSFCTRYERFFMFDYYVFIVVFSCWS